MNHTELSLLNFWFKVLNFSIEIKIKTGAQTNSKISYKVVKPLFQICTKEDVIEAQRKKQHELIYQLKGQLEVNFQL